MKIQINISERTYYILEGLKLASTVFGMGYGAYAATKEPGNKKEFFSEITQKCLPKSVQESTPCKACFGAITGGVLAKMPILTFTTWAVTSMTGKKQIPLTPNIKIEWGDD
ncbi:MAG: hypothetical protein JSS09_09025 [Verrucomicrobia bacterium]|nr:hypothetical protein [Verrucomicrobiota bacterium]